MHLHHPSNPLLVIAGAKVVVDQGRHTPVTIRRPFPDHLLNLIQDHMILLATVKARAGSAVAIGAAAAGS
jgi:hypothetical protein